MEGWEQVDQRHFLAIDPRRLVLHIDIVSIDVHSVNLHLLQLLHELIHLACDHALSLVFSARRVHIHKRVFLGLVDSVGEGVPGQELELAHHVLDFCVDDSAKARALGLEFALDELAQPGIDGFYSQRLVFRVGDDFLAIIVNG